jgi:hypothetical protein
MKLAPSKTAYSILLQKNKSCVAKDPVSVDSLPVCKDCKIRLKDKYDDQEIRSFTNGIDASLQLGITALKQMLSPSVLELDKEKKLADLMTAIDSTDTKLFMTSLSDSLVDHLCKLFEKANIETVPLSVSNFLKNHSFVEEDQIESVTSAFRNELANALEKARKQRPGKKIRIALGD